MTYEEFEAKRHVQYQAKWERIKADPEALAKERERLRERYASNIIKERERSRAKYQRTKARVKERTSKWFKEHAEWDRERKRARYAENPDHYRQRSAYFKNREWLSFERIQELWPRLQNGPCEICGKTGEVMRIDHCHTRKVFRGVLCHGCNVSLGHFHDDADTLRRAIAYLEGCTQ